MLVTSYRLYYKALVLNLVIGPTATLIEMIWPAALAKMGTGTAESQWKAVKLSSLRV